MNTSWIYRSLARITVAAHVLWTIFVFGGGVYVLFNYHYGWWQMYVLTFTIFMWFAFGQKCCLTLWAAYFEKKAEIHDGGQKPFMAKYLSKIFNTDIDRRLVAAAIVVFYVASYIVSIIALTK